MSQGFNATKTPGRPSHEAIEESSEKTSDSDEQKIDHIAMESAKRAQNRIHSDEGSTPGSQEFTK